MANEPGYYPDPTGQTGYRYWDGVQWTEYVSAPKKNNASRIVAISAASILGVVGFVVIAWIVGMAIIVMLWAATA